MNETRCDEVPGCAARVPRRKDNTPPGAALTVRAMRGLAGSRPHDVEEDRRERRPERPALWCPHRSMRRTLRAIPLGGHGTYRRTDTLELNYNDQRTLKFMVGWKMWLSSATRTHARLAAIRDAPSCATAPCMPCTSGRESQQTPHPRRPRVGSGVSTAARAPCLISRGPARRPHRRLVVHAFRANRTGKCRHARLGASVTRARERAGRGTMGRSESAPRMSCRRPGSIARRWWPHARR